MTAKQKANNVTPKRNISKLPLDKLTRDELNTLATKRKIDYKAFSNKRDLIAALSTKPKGAQRKGGRKLDPVKAYDFYFGDNTRSYADVAKEFGVSKNAVEAIAKVTIKEGPEKGTWKTWAEHRQDLVEIAQKKRDEEYRKSIPVRNEEHLKQYRNLQIATSNKITALALQGEWLVNPKTGQKVKVQEFDARQLADVAKALKLAIDGERVILGLATSVATIKPGSDDETGKGWGELLALAMKQAGNEQIND